MIKSIIYKTIVRQKYIIHYDLSMTICRKLSGCARCLAGQGVQFWDCHWIAAAVSGGKPFPQTKPKGRGPLPHRNSLWDPGNAPNGPIWSHLGP